MQILSHTYELNELLIDLDPKKFNKNIEATILVEWNKLRQLMWSENCTIAPWGFINAIREVAKKKNINIFSGHAQNDVGEFLLFIIDCLHCGLKREVDMTISGTVQNDTDSLAQECYNMMQKMYKSEYSEILNIFYGISVTQIKSKDTNVMLSRTCEPFSILSLPIPQRATSTIFECLDLYREEEELCGENAWFNDKTKSKQNVKKGTIFWNLPNILIIDLKRYNNSNKKIHSLVDTPLEDLDLSRYVDGYNSSKYIYDLFGTGNHSGGAMGGHYTANIKNPNGKWYSFNDTTISEIADNKVISAYTYCLFYRKKNKV